jgi:uncharacterized membrane protein (UPF0127 family)
MTCMNKPLACLALAVLPALAGAEQPSVYPEWPHTTLSIKSAKGAQHFNIDIADTPERQEQGLMRVRFMGADQGMIFPLEPPRMMTMWMKNTVMSLDLLFIDARGRVICIRANAVPMSEAYITCPQAVRAVLELNAGEAARRGIREGDQASHALFGAR